MAGFVIGYEFKRSNSYIEIDNGNVKFWLGEGLPDFEGDLEGFNTMFPEFMQELINRKIVKKKV